MQIISPAKRQISLYAVMAWLANVAPAHAYDFTLGDLQTEMQIVQDYATGKLAGTAVSEQARRGLEHPLGPPNAIQILKSGLLQVCPTSSITNQYGRTYAFRSHHEAGFADWNITTPINNKSQIVNVLITVEFPNSERNGAPLALTPMFPGSKMEPPSNLCLSPEKLRLLEQREKEACAEYPRLCSVGKAQ